MTKLVLSKHMQAYHSERGLAEELDYSFLYTKSLNNLFKKVLSLALGAPWQDRRVLDAAVERTRRYSQCVLPGLAPGQFGRTTAALLTSLLVSVWSGIGLKRGKREREGSTPSLQPTWQSLSAER